VPTLCFVSLPFFSEVVAKPMLPKPPMRTKQSYYLPSVEFAAPHPSSQVKILENFDETSLQ
jgi:hypothetical protein